VENADSTRWPGATSGSTLPSRSSPHSAGSLDSKIKIWDVAGAGRPVKRTYLGHTGAVRQVNFNNDGRRCVRLWGGALALWFASELGVASAAPVGHPRMHTSWVSPRVGPSSGATPPPRSFLSVSYDRHVKLWDTETGAALLSVTHGKVPYCATWYPQDNGVFLVGSANRKVMQYDARSGEVVLEYNYHLGAVDTVTFVDDGRRIGASRLRVARHRGICRAPTPTPNNRVGSVARPRSSFIPVRRPLPLPRSHDGRRQEAAGVGLQRARAHQVHHGCAQPC
jgi:WD40 repeat protein